jgi:hypothetical protein
LVSFWMSSGMLPDNCQARFNWTTERQRKWTGCLRLDVASHLVVGQIQIFEGRAVHQLSRDRPRQATALEMQFLQQHESDG